ncbi:Hsp20/alpha crystallin family protein [Kribbella sp. CA-247076]|uniref:Hsp20/alpha crystallin family protein n=1 Tax=Kribbella sp. CA-247076 TaxID=3239941 RepID=UPI003D91082B
MPRTNQRPAAVRWLPTEPFAHLEDIHRRTSQLMHELARPHASGTWWPAVDLEETDDECLVDIDLPGATTQDLVVEHDGRSLTVRGRIPDREHSGTMHRHARHPGPLHLTIDLPCSVQADGLTATLTNGVLTIRAPKSRPGPARRVQIVDLDGPREERS